MPKKTPFFTPNPPFCDMAVTKGVDSQKKKIISSMVQQTPLMVLIVHRNDQCALHIIKTKKL